MSTCGDVALVNHPFSIRLFAYLGFCCQCTFLFLACSGPPAGEGITRVWAVDDGEKVKQDDLHHWAATSPDNPVWDGSTVRLLAARNEIVAFQLILEASGTGAKNITVRLDSLSNGRDVLCSPRKVGNLFDFADRRIEIFAEQYMSLPQRSSWIGYWGWWVARPLPDEEFIGELPDALIPLDAPPGRYAHGMGGGPLEIGGGKTQAVWCDIFVPRDAGPGLYHGAVHVLEGGELKFRIPVELRVCSFALSDTTHFRNFFHVDPSLLERHPGVANNTPEYWRLFKTYMSFFHRHRVDLTDGRRNPEEFRDHLLGYYAGHPYTRDEGYDGPGVGVGNSVYCIGTYDQFGAGWKSGFFPATQEGWQHAADTWEGIFQSAAPHVLRFKYMKDEPGPEDFAGVIERSGWIRSSSGAGKHLKVFCTVHLDPALYGAVDVWALTVQSGYRDQRFNGETAGFVLEKVRQRRPRGDLFALYGGTRPAYGVGNAIDDQATAFRVNDWIAWKYGVDLYFQWQVGLYAEESYRLNPWATLEIVAGQDRKWGNGCLVYAGMDRDFPRDSRGVPGPIASIRLKSFRRGQQDFEYLWLARSLGVRTDDLVDRIVPAAFDDYGSTRTYTSQSQQPVWAQRGFEFERVRRVLADRIEAALHGR